MEMDFRMELAKPLPGYLVKRYHGWKATTYEENRAWFRTLAEGQHPRAMVISCCDSRVHVTALFGADQGEFFVHRNIASLVPEYAPGGRHQGTSAAIEYAVTALKVAHIIVVGHSQCGGVQGCLDMCSGKAPQLEKEDSFVGRWVDILKPKYDDVKDIADPVEQARQMERRAVVNSLENLMTFPFVKDAVAREELSLHGLWTDIGAGGLQCYDADTDTFKQV